MAETPSAPSASPPSRAEAMGWVGYEVDEIGGAAVGRVHGFFVDAGSGEPAWLIASVGGRRGLRLRRRQARLVAIPLRDCAGGGGRVWVAHGRDAIGSAPVVDPTRPLLREHELAICAHYGIGEQVGRAAEVAGRPEGAVTSEPAK
jgi:PRC-barrel domain